MSKGTCILIKVLVASIRHHFLVQTLLFYFLFCSLFFCRMKYRKQQKKQTMFLKFETVI
jgi:hypothetical protein